MKTTGFLLFLQDLNIINITRIQKYEIFAFRIVIAIFSLCYDTV